ncbi:SPRY-domain-containing protein [Neoconidiobolus thromboides FSU 785]|nr:SPRY-domain-containing protein [Neoconidiobolus thromboides FSU 785]
MLLTNLRERYHKYRIKNQFERLVQLSRLSLIFNDTSEEVIKATEELIQLSHQAKRFVDVLLYLMDTLDIHDELSPQLVSHILEITALPNFDTLNKLVQKIIKKIKTVKNQEESDRLRCISSIILGIIAEKLAGKGSSKLFDNNVMELLLDNIKGDYSYYTHLFTFISLENFALTNENKQRLLGANYKQLLKDYLDKLDLKSNLTHQIKFCVLHSKVDFLEIPVPNQATQEALFSGINCALDWCSSSSFIKFSEDLSQCRNDRIGFATTLGTTCITDGKWYFEVLLLSGGIMQVGWATQAAKFKPEDGVGIGDEEHSFGFDGLRNLNWYKGESTLYGINSWKSGDIIGVYIDLDKGSGYYTLNGKELGGTYYFEPGDINLFCEIEGGLKPGISLTSYQQVLVNFGNLPFRFSPIEDYRLLSDYGQLTQTIKMGPKYLNQKLQEDDKLDDKCQICYLNEAGFQLLPCKHDGFCMECINQMDICPFCRINISSWKKTN